MPPEQTQPNMMGGDESAAALSFATMLQEQMMPNAQMPMEQMQQEAPQEAKMPQGGEMMSKSEENPALDSEALKNVIMKDVKSVIKKEMDGLKEMIKDALNDDDEETETKEDTK